MAIPHFLEELLTATGPYSYETPAADVSRASAGGLAAEVTSDTVGSSVARVPAGDGAPLVGLVGHIDEIGLVVKHITDEGVLRFGPIGGWDPQILVGQRVGGQTADGQGPGGVGRKPNPPLQDEDRQQGAEVE